MSRVILQLNFKDILKEDMETKSKELLLETGHISISKIINSMNKEEKKLCNDLTNEFGDILGNRIFKTMIKSLYYNQIKMNQEDIDRDILSMDMNPLCIKLIQDLINSKDLVLE
jgi:hypothetical protein